LAVDGGLRFPVGELRWEDRLFAILDPESANRAVLLKNSGASGKLAA
jgi:hypothetical protein